MRVLMINPATKRNNDPLSLPLGLLSIGTYLKRRDHSVMIFESGANRKKFSKVLKQFSPDIIGISVISGKAVQDALALSKQAKKNGITVVWGGFLPSALPELVLKTGFVDIVSIGEGEYTWCELLQAMSNGEPLETVKGLAFIANNQTVITPVREMADLASLPANDFELIDINNYFYSYYNCKRAINLYASKGCFGHCTFCYNSNFNKSTHRSRPVEHVIQEMCYLKDKYNVDGIVFNDDLMFENKNEMYQFCTAVRDADLEIIWGCFGRIGQFEKTELKYMSDAGCRWMFFGVESGSRDMLQTIRKGIDYDKIEKTYIDCAEVGIVTRAGFIIGFPGETEEQLKETIALAKKLRTSQISFYYYSLVPNSEAYIKLLDEKKTKQPENLMGFEGMRPFDKLVNFSSVSNIDLRVVYSYFLLRRFFTSGETRDDESSSWRAIASDFLIKSLKEFSFEKVFYCLWSVMKSIIIFLSHPKIRKKYRLRIFMNGD